jgi:arylformamidase
MAPAQKIFRDYDQAELDKQYNQRAWVPNAEEILRRYALNSDAVRARIGEPHTVAYGPSPAESLDIYRTDRPQAPIQIFLHGGAWRLLNKRVSAFAAEAFVRAGAHFVAVDFAALPDVTLAALVDQVRGAVAWVHRHAEDFGADRERLYVTGHSSGAHLAAMAMTTDWPGAFGLPPDAIRAGLCASGIYDLLPVRLSARNDYVQLDAESEQALSPQRHLDRLGCPLVVANAEGDTDEFRRQGRDFASAISRAGGSARYLDGHGFNHFDIVETLADPQGFLGRLALGQMELAG